MGAEWGGLSGVGEFSRIVCSTCNGVSGMPPMLIMGVAGSSGWEGGGVETGGSDGSFPRRPSSVASDSEAALGARAGGPDRSTGGVLRTNTGFLLIVFVRWPDGCWVGFLGGSFLSLGAISNSYHRLA